MRPVFVSDDVARKVLTWPAAIDRLRQAYATPQPSAATPPRSVARGPGIHLRALPAVPAGSRFMGAKLFGKARNGQVTYAIILMDQETSEVVCLLDGNTITAIRTAATSALAVDFMAPPGPMRLGILGSGMEARSHYRAVAAVRPVERASVFSPTPANREAFAKEFSCTPVASPAEAVAGASVVLAAARARNEMPIFSGDDLADGMLIVSIGSTLPEQREVDLRTIERSDLIVADMPEEMATGTGDFIAATRGGVAFHDKLATLGDLVAGKLTERLRKARLSMFKSAGSALQDLTVAGLAYEQAVAQGLAVELPIDFAIKH